MEKGIEQKKIIFLLYENQERMFGIREHIIGMHAIGILFQTALSHSSFYQRGLWYLNSDIYVNVVSHHNMRAVLMRFIFNVCYFPVMISMFL